MHIYVDFIENETCSISADITPGYTYFKAECIDIDSIYKIDVDYTSIMHDILKMMNSRRAKNGYTIFKYVHLKYPYEGGIKLDGEVLNECLTMIEDILHDIISSAYTRRILKHNRSAYIATARRAHNKAFPEIRKVIFNKPATIVIWSDRTKTVVKCSKEDIFDPEKGLAMCFVKKLLGNTGRYYDLFKQYCDSYQPQPFTTSELEDIVTARPWFLTTKPRKN